MPISVRQTGESISVARTKNFDPQGSSLFFHSVKYLKMSFAFGFGGDDIDSKDDYSASSIDGVKQVRMTQPSQRSPRRLDLREMVREW